MLGVRNFGLSYTTTTEKMASLTVITHIFLKYQYAFKYLSPPLIRATKTIHMQFLVSLNVQTVTKMSDFTMKNHQDFSQV